MNKSIKTALSRLCGDPNCARERLLQTAGMLYAERGLDAVSTRELTGEAGVNLAAIAYYFGGKDGLRDAVIDTVIERTRERVGPIVARLSSDVADARGDRRDLSRAAARFMRAYLGTTLPLGPENWTVTVVMRAMSTRSEAHDRLYDTVFAPMMNAANCHAVPPTPQGPHIHVFFRGLTDREGCWSSCCGQFHSSSAPFFLGALPRPVVATCSHVAAIG